MKGPEAASLKDPRIRTELVEANGLVFETDMTGDGNRLALCLHGFPEHAISWRYQLPMLADLGYTAWAPNLRGYGNSSRPKGVAAYSIENLLADVTGLVEAAGKEHVTLLAHDWGAVIAWYFAMRKLRPLEKLVICNVPHPAAMRRALGPRQITRFWYVFVYQLPWLPEALIGRRPLGEMLRGSASSPDRFPDELVRIFSDAAAAPGALTAMLNYYRALVRGGGDRRQQKLGYPIIETPTLMLWGEDDAALTKETTFGTEDYVSDLTIRYLSHVSHWVQQEAPEAVNGMIRAFLEGRPVPELGWEARLIPPA